MMFRYQNARLFPEQGHHAPGHSKIGQWPGQERRRQRLHFQHQKTWFFDSSFDVDHKGLILQEPNNPLNFIHEAFERRLIVALDRPDAGACLGVGGS